MNFTIASNLQHVCDVLTDNSTWAFSIVLDSTTSRKGSYVNVRLRVHVRASVVNCHLIAIQRKDSHTGEEIFNHVKNLLMFTVGDIWTTELLYVATDGFMLPQMVQVI